MIARLLAALDDSPRAPAVAAAAAELAQALRAHLHLLRIVDVPTEFPPSAHVTHPDLLPRILRDKGERELAALAAPHAHLVPTFSVIAGNEPWRAILDVAHSMAADLLVIGTHSRHGFERILGTTTTRIVKHADRNLFIVHPAEADPLSRSA